MEMAQQQCETVTGISNPRERTTGASIDVGAAPFGEVAILGQIQCIGTRRNRKRVESKMFFFISGATTNRL
jgi:hypothetical protein